MTSAFFRFARAASRNSSVAARLFATAAPAAKRPMTAAERVFIEHKGKIMVGFTAVSAGILAVGYHQINSQLKRNPLVIETLKFLDQAFASYLPEGVKGFNFVEFPFTSDVSPGKASACGYIQTKHGLMQVKFNLDLNKENPTNLTIRDLTCTLPETNQKWYWQTLSGQLSLTPATHSSPLSQETEVKFSTDFSLPTPTASTSDEYPFWWNLFNRPSTAQLIAGGSALVLGSALLYRRFHLPSIVRALRSAAKKDANVQALCGEPLQVGRKMDGTATNSLANFKLGVRGPKDGGILHVQAMKATANGQQRWVVSSCTLKMTGRNDAVPVRFQP